MAYNILYPPDGKRPMKALDSVRHVRSHAQHDGWRAFKSISLQTPAILIAASIIYGGLMNHETPQDGMINSISFGLACASAWLTQTTVEIRKKLDFMKDSFKAASWSFNDKDREYTLPLKQRLEKQRDTIEDVFNFRKYPIRNTLAAGFALACAAKPEHAPFMAHMSLFFMTMGITLKEQDETWQIDDAAWIARESIEKAEERERIDDLKREIRDLLGPNHDF